jgi:hypothetical protein
MHRLGEDAGRQAIRRIASMSLNLFPEKPGIVRPAMGQLPPGKDQRTAMISIDAAVIDPAQPGRPASMQSSAETPSKQVMTRPPNHARDPCASTDGTLKLSIIEAALPSPAPGSSR